MSYEEKFRDIIRFWVFFYVIYEIFILSSPKTNNLTLKPLISFERRNNLYTFSLSLGAWVCACVRNICSRMNILKEFSISYSIGIVLHNVYYTLLYYVELGSLNSTALYNICFWFIKLPFRYKMSLLDIQVWVLWEKSHIDENLLWDLLLML